MRIGNADSIRLASVVTPTLENLNERLVAALKYMSNTELKQRILDNLKERELRNVQQ